MNCKLLRAQGSHSELKGGKWDAAAFWNYPQVSPLNNITLKNVWFMNYSIVWFNVFHLHLHRDGSIIWDRDCYNINIPAYEMGKGRDLMN